MPYEAGLDSVLPTRDQAELLQMEASQPCLLLTRRTWLREVPITLVRCLHSGARYRLGSRVRTDGNPITSQIADMACARLH